MVTFVILAQVASIIGWVLLIYSYYKEDIDKLLYVQIISSIFYCISYLFLGAYSGFLVCFIELLKGIGYYKTDKDDLIFLASLPLYILMAIFSFDHIVSLLPIIGSIIDGFSLTKNKKVATIGSIIANTLWVIYDIIILAYASAITDGALIVSNISLLLFGYSMLLKSSKIRIVQCRNLSKNVYSAIYELDKNEYGIEYTWPLNYEKAIKNKNEKNLFLLKFDNDIIGYFNCLVINEEEYNKIISSDVIIKEYDINNIVELQKRRKNYLIIDSINLKNKFRNEVSADIIIKKFEEIIVNNYENSYNTESVLALALNKFEEEVLEKIGFTKYKEYNSKATLYKLEKETIEQIYLKSSHNRKKYKIIENYDVTEELLKDIKNLDKKFYKDEYTWEDEYQISLYKKNPNSIIMVTYEGKLIGYLNFLVIKKEKYNEMLNSNKIIDEFELEEILPFYKNRKNYITVNSVVISKKHQDNYAIKLLTRRLKKNLKSLNANNFKIGGINAIAVSADGQKFASRLGFEKTKELEDGNYLYLLEGKNLEKYLK